jgi:hypothetical protein
MRETSTSRVRANSVRAPRRALVLAISAVVMLLFGTSAAASPPLRDWGHYDDTVRLAGASNACGFDIFGHFVGDFHFTVFYDNAGNIVREVDTFPSAKLTIFAPSTGRSYTSANPAVLHTTYTNGAAIGSTAIASLTGLLEKVGNVDMDSGRVVFEGVVDHYENGVPFINFVSLISTSGPDLDAFVGVQRCAAMRA